MFNRFVDWFTQGEGDDDFAVRSRNPFFSRFVALFTAAFVVLLATAWMSQEGSLLVYVLALLAVIGSLAWFTVYFVVSHRDAVLTAEFQNALFSSAAGVGQHYCLILRQDGTIVYFDPGFLRHFPESSGQYSPSLERIFMQAGVPDAAITEIYGFIGSGSGGKVLLEGRTDGAPMILSIDPLPRPHGYWVLRARDYVLNRAGTQPAEPSSVLLQAALAHAPVGLFVADRDGRLEVTSRALEDWLGYAPGEPKAAGLSLRDIVYQQGNGRPGQISIDKEDGEFTFQHKNGSLQKAVVSQHAVTGKEGEVEGCTGIVDIPGSKRKSRPADEPQGFRYFIEHSPIAIARLSASGAILERNESFRKLTRLKDLHGGFLLDALDPMSRGDVERQLARLTGGGPAAEAPLEVKIQRDGSPATASLYLTRTEISPEGAPDIIAHLIDTTEQKNLELRFAHSQKMQAVGQLAGGVAHDFNNLLTAMIGFCDLLLMRHPAGDPSFADIMQVKQNANRAANLVRQLLAFSRRQTLQPKMLDVTDVLAELSNLIRRLIGENIELKVVHGRDVGMIKADQGQIEQVFINLAVNARDAMPRGGSLTIRTSHVTVDKANPLPRYLIAPSDDEQIAEGDYVLVEIADTGTGIPLEIVQKIFEPFFSTKEVGSGTGLGLATCYGIVKQTGGYIFVTTGAGKGTAFSLYFPHHTIDASAVPEAEHPERATSDDLSGKGTVLLVEDENPVRIFAARALRNKGYTVLEADCGETALEVMSQDGEKVDVIISDVIMPGMNGPTMIEEIAAKYPALHPKVIFISGYAEDAFADSVKERPDFQFLPKPFTLKQLAAKVKEVTGG